MSNNHCELNKLFKSPNTDQLSVVNDIGSLFLQSELSDLVLIVQNRQFPVHKVILAARSQYFRALLYSGLKESYQSEIILQNANEEAFEHVLKYIYKGTINVNEMTDELIMELLALSHQYGLASIERQISSHLGQFLSLDNVVTVLNVAVLYEIRELTDMCLRFLDKHSSDFLAGDMIVGLSENALCRVISRDSFCSSEIEIFDPVMQWIRNSESARDNNDVINRVLTNIRFSLIPISDLLDRVRPSGLVPSDRILDAIQDQIKGNPLPHRGLMIPEENLASPDWNVTLLQGGTESNNGRSLTTMDHGDCTESIFAEHVIDDQSKILVRLGNPSKINLIRMQLHDRDSRSYSYLIEVSLDQQLWTIVADYRKLICRSWQTLYFDPIVSRYIRITGTRNTVARSFTILKFICMYTDNPYRTVGGLLVPDYNAASTQHHATVIEGVSRNRNSLLNGDTRNYNWDTGYTCHQLGNGAIVVQLAQPYILNNIKFLLWDLDDRSYSYTVEMSVDKSKWIMIADKSAELCSSYQTIVFDSQPVVFIRIIGTYNTANEVFHIVHLEASHKLISESTDESIQ